MIASPRYIFLGKFPGLLRQRPVENNLLDKLLPRPHPRNDGVYPMPLAFTLTQRHAEKNLLREVLMAITFMLDHPCDTSYSEGTHGH